MLQSIILKTWLQNQKNNLPVFYDVECPRILIVEVKIAW
jgi:hypothetical protein